MEDKKSFILELKEMYKSCLYSINQGIEKATSGHAIKNLYDLINEAETINNILCNDIDIKEYTSNIEMLQDLRNRENKFVFNLISKLMNENKDKNWKAVFNYLMNTDFE